MGNTVVCKPSELTPMTADLMMQVIDEVGLPAGVVNLVHGDGAGAGAPLVAHSDVDLVSFTGGTSTGEKVAASAAPAFKKLSLELGGKNASIVFADCDMDSTVAGVVRAGFLNQGQDLPVRLEGAGRGLRLRRVPRPLRGCRRGDADR